ncbi:MAG: NAD-dependent epimerase/dehydratase family protein [Actinomycetota bacterium]
MSSVATVALVGADGPLARRVEQLIDDCPGLARAGGEDVAGSARVVVDLGSSNYDRRAERRESATESCSAMLDTADRRCAQHIVFVSSALVYGASPNNPIPITEDAVLRPDVEFVFARQLASAEELVEQWRRARPGRTAAVLRPALALAEGESSRLARAVVAGLGWRFAVADPPAQFLHLDDLAAAVVTAVGARLDGVYNVAPDGWVAGERVRALSGERPRVPLPDRVRDVLARLSWRFQRGPIPPGLAPYTQASWVVANGRLRAEGWRPTITNEQTYVEATEAPWWTMITPKRRQELTLGGAVVGAVGAAVLGLWAARRISRRRARRPR